jgi:copper chaperone CopZ
MKQLLFMISIALIMSACQGSTDSRQQQAEETRPVTQTNPENLVKISLDVEGMTCAGCEGAVVSSLKNIEGVAEASASHQTGKTEVQFDKTLVNEEENGGSYCFKRVQGYRVYRS